jgi:hypothetical protein
VQILQVGRIVIDQPGWRALRSQGMSDKQTTPVDLKPEMIQFLTEVTKTYKLDDTGKAVRCLINYARENADKLDEIFSEVRCTSC